jgi:hypothetical protein
MTLKVLATNNLAHTVEPQNQNQINIMSKSRHPEIRELLLASEDGLTINEMAAHFECDLNTLYNTMQQVWGVYIDRWAGPKRGQFTAVYMCVEVPENSPHPKGKTNDQSE